MVGCKDDPAHKLRRLRTLNLQSPTQDERNAHLAHWLQDLPPTPAISSDTSSLLSAKVPNPYASSPDSQPPNPRNNPIRRPSYKRKALTELDPLFVRKSARLAEKQGSSKYRMPKSLQQNKPAGQNAEEDSARRQETERDKILTRGLAKRNAEEVGMHRSEASKEMVPTTKGKQAQMSGSSSSGEENRDPGENAVTTTIRLLPAIMIPDPGSPPKRKNASSRPSSPTKSSTKSSKAPAQVSQRHRLGSLNPPVRYYQQNHLIGLGKNKLASVKELWLRHIVSRNKGIIPQALKTKVPFLDPDEEIPQIDALYFAPETRYVQNEYERIWWTATNIVMNAVKCRDMGAHESHWITHVIGPVLDCVSKLQHFSQDEMRIIALDIQTIGIDPPSLCSYSADAQFRDLNKRIDLALGLDLSQVDRDVLERGVYESETAFDSINQTSSFVNFTPMFLNIEVKRKNTNIDPLIQLAAWISAEFQKRRIENYSIDMPVLAIEISEHDWYLSIVYASPDPVDTESYGLNFVDIGPIGNTRSLLGFFELLDCLSRCADWGVGSYQKWFRKEILGKYKPSESGGLQAGKVAAAESNLDS